MIPPNGPRARVGPSTGIPTGWLYGPALPSAPQTRASPFALGPGASSANTLEKNPLLDRTHWSPARSSTSPASCAVEWQRYPKGSSRSQRSLAIQASAGRSIFGEWAPGSSVNSLPGSKRGAKDTTGTWLPLLRSVDGESTSQAACRTTPL